MKTEPNNIEYKTPSEFYKSIRPEYFSDSEIAYKIELPKEILEFELNNISKNQKQDLFESLSRRLAEKFISPNLIPQVGPTGGGDGKTDSDTHPVSKFISERWFISEANWEKGDKWAFAFSAKTEWKSKVKSDVKKIIGTKRGYNLIYFITNQSPSSKKKKDAQDEFKKDFEIDVIILDREWILEKIYSNNLIELVVNSLNLSPSYLSKKEIIGKNDSDRIERLKELEQNISNPNRYLEYDLQLVEDTLESAVLSRELEKPKEEVIGKFKRTIRFCEKTNNSKQWLRIYYQAAFTYLNYYDDYISFISSYNSFKNNFPSKPLHTELELYNNLLNLLHVLISSNTYNEIDLKITLKEEREIFFKILDNSIDDKELLATASIAKTYKAIHMLMPQITSKNNRASIILYFIEAIKEGVEHIGYPFDGISKIVETLGGVLPGDLTFDKLVDTIADIASKRKSDLLSGLTYYHRGVQKLSANYNLDSIKYFGKATLRLAKNESEELMYLSLIGMANAYETLGLIWSSNNCLYIAGSIAFKSWYQKGVITNKTYDIIYKIVGNELKIGRIPVFLMWYELLGVISSQVKTEKNTIDSISLIDACLAVRILNSVDIEISTLSILPDLLASNSLSLSEDSCLYLLGQYDRIMSDYKAYPPLSTKAKIDDYFTKMYSQPFKEQIIYNTNFLATKESHIKTNILGCEFIVRIYNKKQLIFGEMLLAFFESFFATSTEEIYPVKAQINFNISDVHDSEKLSFVYTEEKSSINLNLHVGIKNFDDELNWNKLMALIGTVTSICFVIESSNKHLEYLFKEEEVLRRLSIVRNHFGAITSIVGYDPKLFLGDWIKDKFKRYDSKRKEAVTFIQNKEFKLPKKEKRKDDFSEIPHNKRKFVSIIENELWDKAIWEAFGSAQSPQVWGMLIILGFQHYEPMVKIFDDWIKRFRKKDETDEIKITIIKGINKYNPNWYRILISSNIKKESVKDGDIIITNARFHEMRPVNSLNLNQILDGFKTFKEYGLVPGKIIDLKSGKVEPIVEKIIIKTHLHIKEAWEIGINDPDRVVIKKDDEPFIPKQVTNPPVYELLRE